MPILISHTPEKYDIAAYCVVFIQFGNLNGFLTALFHSHIPISSKYLVLGTLVLGVLSLFFSAFAYKIPVPILDEERRFVFEIKLWS